MRLFQMKPVLCSGDNMAVYMAHQQSIISFIAKRVQARTVSASTPTHAMFNSIYCLPQNNVWTSFN
jgi:hypothetical protein